MTAGRRVLWGLALVGGLLGAGLVFRVLPFVSLQSLDANQQVLDSFRASHPAATAAAFVLVYITFAALPLPGAEVLTIAAGALFGLTEGTVLVSFASSIGATIAFALSRWWLRDRVRQRFAVRVGQLSGAIEAEGAFYLFALRLVPVFPFFLVNLLMGLTSLRLATFYWVSQIGMLPATIAFVNAGLQLAQIRSLAGILSARVLLSFAVLGLLPLAARLFVKAWRKAR